MKQVGSKAIDLTKAILLELKQVTCSDLSPVSSEMLKHKFVESTLRMNGGYEAHIVSE